MTTLRAPHPCAPALDPRWPLALLLAAGCSTTAGSTRSPAGVDPHAREKLMSHEHGGLVAHPVRLFDGAVEARVEARVAPKPECKTEASGFGCTMALELGKDDDGLEHAIFCAVSTDFEPFGPLLKLAQGPFQLMEPPVLTAEPRGEGLAVSFMANSHVTMEGSTGFGTFKVAVLYAPGYTAACFDPAAGGRETFARVTSGFFDSLKLGPRPRNPAVFSMAYQVREGDRTVGFRYGYVTTDAKPNPRFTEHGTSFSLDADEKSWKVHDTALKVVRKADGAIESYRTQSWRDGIGLRMLSAKPAEGGRLRVKVETGSRSDAIELTPKAMLDTELWAADRLGRLATNAAEQYVYAWPIVDDGDPSLGYVLLSPGGTGVVLEQERSHRRFDEAPAPEDDARDELHIDARGLVTKEIQATSIDELLFARGELPGTAREPAAVVAVGPGSSTGTTESAGGGQ